MSQFHFLVFSDIRLTDTVQIFILKQTAFKKFVSHNTIYLGINSYHHELLIRDKIEIHNIFMITSIDKDME